jgi:putative ABC transport system permease protein
VLADLRFALRQFLKTPGFSLIAVATLALAIGANVAIFSAIDAVLLHPLPYPDAARLVSLGENLLHFNLSKIPASPPEVIDYGKMATTFAQIGAMDAAGAFTLTGDGNPETIPGMHITASIFSMLGVKPVAGGLFTAAEEQYGQHHVAVISEGLWKRRFGSDPSIIGRNIQINRESYRVMGVIRPILEYRSPAEIWTPVSFQPSDLEDASRGRQYIDVIGKLRPGVSLEQSN